MKNRKILKHFGVLIFIGVLSIVVALLGWRELVAEAIFTLGIAIVIGVGVPAVVFVPMFLWHYARHGSATIAWKCTWSASKSFLLRVLEGL